ncbi:MAG: hypothetical protein ACLUE8_00970 [Lachnospiraceae bacterium]
MVQQEERQDSYQPRIPENAPRLDGYRLGYRAAPQRPSYQNRDNGYRKSSYSGGNASYNNVDTIIPITTVTGRTTSASSRRPPTAAMASSSRCTRLGPLLTTV